MSFCLPILAVDFRWSTSCCVVIFEAHKVLWLECEKKTSLAHNLLTYHCYLKGKVEEIIIRWKMKRNVFDFLKGCLRHNVHTEVVTHTIDKPQEVSVAFLNGCPGHIEYTWPPQGNEPAERSASALCGLQQWPDLASYFGFHSLRLSGLKVILMWKMHSVSAIILAKVTTSSLEPAFWHTDVCGLWDEGIVLSPGKCSGNSSMGKYTTQCLP